MPIAPADIITLSRLLDVALDLDPAQVEVWLADLAQEHQRLIPRLRDMLAEHKSNTPNQFLSDGPKLDADTAVGHAGDSVGPYRLIREIGRGGMGAVWLAERDDGTVQRRVALKLPRLAWDAGLAERMNRERDIGALLEHPHIARLYDAGVDLHGRPYLAFEHIAGQSIDSYCEARSLSLTARLRLFNQVARAVAYAHGRLVVHRDLKPSNVMVTEDGQVHLLDFGIAKLLQDTTETTQLTREQGRLLTPHYASPEQVRGDPVTVASDVYSLGVLLYQLLTNSLPYNPKRKTLGAIEEAILEGEPPLASTCVSDKTKSKALRGELDAVLAKALRRESAQRYQTVEALADDVERHLDGERVLARPDSTWYRLSKVVRRHRVPIMAAGVTTLAVVSGASVAMWQAHQAREAAERSRVVKEFVVDVFKVNAPGVPSDNEARQLPAEVLLQRGAALIATKFPGQPQLQVELYGIVGGIFMEMGVPQLAAEYAKLHVDALQSIGASTEDEIQATIQLAQALIQQDQLKEAKLQVDRVLAMEMPSPHLRAKALALLAQILVKLEQNAEALHVASSIEQDVLGSSIPSVARARARWIRAMVFIRQNRDEESFSLFRSAIDEAVAAEGGLSPTAIDIRLHLASVLVARGLVEDARTHANTALQTLRATGGAGEMRAAMEESNFTLSLFNRDQMDFAGARAVIERDRAIVRSRGPLVPDFVRASIDFDLGRAYLYWGNISLADQLIADSTATLRMTAQSRTDVYYLAAYQGLVEKVVGRHAEADIFLREALELKKSDGADNHPWSTQDYVEVATNLFMQQRFEEAEVFLSTAPRFRDLTGQVLGFYQSASSAILRALAEVKLERGDVASGLAMLPADENLSEGPNAEQQRVRGELFCAIGRHRDGMLLLDPALKFFERISYEHSPYVARLRAVTGLCALADGRREYAAELARQAHASFEAQPAVSPYFKRPLAKLDLRLKRGA